jgi:hypothetical protein
MRIATATNMTILTTITNLMVMTTNTQVIRIQNVPAVTKRDKGIIAVGDLYSFFFLISSSLSYVNNSTIKRCLFARPVCCALFRGCVRAWLICFHLFHISIVHNPTSTHRVGSPIDISGSISSFCCAYTNAEYMLCAL